MAENQYRVRVLMRTGLGEKILIHGVNAEQLQKTPSHNEFSFLGNFPARFEN